MFTEKGIVKQTASRSWHSKKPKENLHIINVLRSTKGLDFSWTYISFFRLIFSCVQYFIITLGEDDFLLFMGTLLLHNSDL